MGSRLSPRITHVLDRRRRFLLIHEAVLYLISLAFLVGRSASEIPCAVESVDSKH